GEEFDVLHALLQFIEYRNAARDERAAVRCRRDAARAAIKKTHAQGKFEVGDTSRDGRLRRGEAFSRLRHAAPFSHGHQDAQIVQLDAALDALNPVLHRRKPNIDFDISGYDTSIGQL